MRSNRVPRKAWLAVALVVVGVLLVAQNSTVLYPDMDSYVVVDQRTITVRVAVADCSWTRVTDVAETPTEVRVKVETWPCPIPLAGTADLVVRDLTVRSPADLASRDVQDANRAGGPRRGSRRQTQRVERRETLPTPGRVSVVSRWCVARPRDGRTVWRYLRLL